MNNSDSGITGIQINCRSINNKLGDLKLLLYLKKPDFMALSETWISNTKYEPRFHNYSVEWKHRDNGNGGGLGLLIKRGIQYNNIILTPYNGGSLEYQAIEIFLTNKSKLVVFHFYNPNQSISTQEMIHYIGQLGQLYLITGDLNAHAPVLSSTCTRSNATGNSLENLLINHDICLINPIDLYTYTNPGTGKKSCLDLCLTSPSIAAETSVMVLSEIGSDHLPVEISIKQDAVTSELSCRKKWKYSKQSLELFSRSIHPSKVNKPCDTDTLVKDFTDRLYCSAEQNIKRTSGKIKIRKNSIWWDSSCSKAVGERRKAYKALSRHPTQQNVELYRQKCEDANRIKTKRKREKFELFISEIHYDTPPTIVWRKVKALKGYTSTDSSPIENGGQFSVAAKEKADLFAHSFQTVSTSGNRTPIDNFDNILSNALKNTENTNYNREITLQELNDALSQSRNSAPGEDDVSYLLLKNLDTSTLEEFLAILNQCYIVGQMPESWKSGLVIPILKPGKPKTCVKSYRPIALLSCLGKTLERIVKNRLEYIAESQNYLSKIQCGFRKEQGTIDVLLRVENTIRSALANKQICIVIYIDLTSAFDTVWGEGLIYKLIQCGLKGNLLRWLHNYFKDRTIKTIIGGAKSDSLAVSNGTPQGAVLSPLLFNLMLRDIPIDDNVDIYVYADDITVSCVGDDVATVRHNMQNYINKFTEWAKKWDMKINPQKTVIQHYTKKKIPCPVIRISNQAIQYKKEQKLLGLFFDSPNLTWRPQIDYLRRDCLKRTDIMKSLASTKWGASTIVLRNFYIAYIRAKIDYGSTIYGSAAPSNLKKLERVQNTCLRLILGGRNTSPALSLQAEACVPPLSIHRDYLNIKLLIKLKHKPIDNETSSFLKLDGNNINVFPLNSFSKRSMKSLSILQMRPLKRVPERPSQIPPWLTTSHFVVLDYDREVFNNADFCLFLETNYPNHKVLFTDGSKIQSGDQSAACAIYSQSHKFSECWKMRPEHSVLSTELYGLFQALTFVQKNNILMAVIFTDSRSALQLLVSPKPKTYRDIVSKINKLLIDLNDIGSVTVHWVKAHCGISGNEIADKMANEGHKNDRSVLYDLTREENISILKSTFNEYWNDFWKFTTELTGKGMFLRNIRENVSIGKPVGKLRCRKSEVALYRLRIGHVGLNEYLSRFNMSETDECEECLVTETIEHYIFHCSAYQRQRDVMLEQLRLNNIQNPSLKDVLGGNEGYSNKRQVLFQIILDYIKSTNKLGKL